MASDVSSSDQRSHGDLQLIDHGSDSDEQLNLTIMLKATTRNRSFLVTSSFPSLRTTDVRLRVRKNLVFYPSSILSTF